MTVVDEHGRPEPPTSAGELDTLLGFLDYQRATLEWKTRGLDAAGLGATVGASAMTLGGLLKHLAFVEDYWFTYRLHERAPAEPFRSHDWDGDPDWDWRSAAADSPEDLRALWTAACERSRAAAADALADGGLDRLAALPWDNGDTPSLRWIVVHMIEEYARHNGHADLLRESVDGETGE